MSIKSFPPFLLAFSLLLQSCDPTTTEEPGTPCATQLDCSKEYKGLCISGNCADNSSENVLTNLYLKMSLTLKNKSPKGLRMVMIAKNAAGVQPTCATLPSMQNAFDPSKNNLTTSPQEMQISSSGDFIKTATFVNGSGRTLMIEMYQNIVQSGKFGPEQPLLGTACVDNVPTDAKDITLDIKAL